MNILFLYTSSLNRSVTAEKLFSAKFPMHQFRSAGLRRKYCKYYSTTLCTEKLLDWANQIFTMEVAHKQRIEEYTGSAYLNKIVVLDIPDEFKIMDPNLVDLLLLRVQISPQRDT